MSKTNGSKIFDSAGADPGVLELGFSTAQRPTGMAYAGREMMSAITTGFQPSEVRTPEAAFKPRYYRSICVGIALTAKSGKQLSQ